MTKKNHNAFLIVATIIIACAGTGLTLVNNIDLDSFQRSFLAGMLATAFTAAEIGFLWNHKVYESVTKRWRKVITFITMFILIGAMGFAFYQELSFAFDKQKLELQSAHTIKLVEKLSDPRAQRIVARQAMVKVNMPQSIPFVICYIAAGLSYVIAGACAEIKRRRIGYGNVIALNPALQSIVERKIGFTNGVKAYRDNKGNGVSLRINGQYAGFISDKEMQ